MYQLLLESAKIYRRGDKKWPTFLDTVYIGTAIRTLTLYA